MVTLVSEWKVDRDDSVDVRSPSFDVEEQMATTSDDDARQSQDQHDAWRLEVRPRNLEDLSKLLAAVVVVCYAFGLLTVNSYLYSLGVSDFALFRSRFVLTGVATLVPIVVAQLWLTIAKLVFQESQARMGLRLNLFVISAATVAAFVTLWLLLRIERWLTSSNDLTVDLGNIPISLQLVAAAFVVCWTSSQFIDIGKRHWTKRTRRPEDPEDQNERSAEGYVDLLPVTVRRQYFEAIKKRTELTARIQVLETRQRQLEANLRSTRSSVMLLLAIGPVVTLMLYLLLFAERAFPLIPEQYGGGKPRQAQLLFRDEAIEDALVVGLQVTPSNSQSPLVDVLWESEDQFVIRPQGSTNVDTVIRIDKSNVSLVIMDLSSSDGSANSASTPIPTSPSAATPAATVD